MDIRVIEDNTGLAPKGERFTAIDDDTYDGAPDGNRIHGTGSTPTEAILDLLEVMLEREEITEDENRELMRIYSLRPYRDPDMAREDMAERAALMREWDE